MADQLKRYRDTVDAPEPEEVVAVNDDSSTGELSNHGVRSEGGIRTSAQWVMIRQQVVFAKQDVILAPSTTYAAKASQTTQFVAALRPNSFAHRPEALRDNHLVQRKSFTQENKPTVRPSRKQNHKGRSGRSGPRNWKKKRKNQQKEVE